LKLHHPWWIEDPDFDLDHHVVRVALPSPGTRTQLDDLISRVASEPLDRSRPLWHVSVAEGLETGHIAFIAKIHHAVADGVMAAQLLASVFTTAPERVSVPPPDVPWRPEQVPSRRRLLQLAVVDIWRVVIGLPGLLARTVRGHLAVLRRKRTGATSPPAPFSGPRLAWNASLTPHRLFVSRSLPLADVKAVKSAFGVSLNDVVLAAVAGGLRAYLLERGELPDKSLVAGVPVSTWQQGQPVRANSASPLFTALPVQVEDPVSRIRLIHDVTAGAKAQFKLLGPQMLAEWSELTPPLPYEAVIRLLQRARIANRLPPPINLVVSNVPGPTEPLYIGGGRLDTIISMGPILEGIGLNVTVWSYLDQLNFGIVAVPEHLPDVRRFADLLPSALEELQKAALDG
jgi:diacylglycerol O-acyltransferase